MKLEELQAAFVGKKVFVTGHTGFKGSWLCSLLLLLGADVSGYALQPNTKPSLFEILNLEQRMCSYFGDIRDYHNLEKVLLAIKPDYVIHLAAQPLVRESYQIPRDTFEINIMGTVNLLEICRNMDCIKSIVNVTTDKVYENQEWIYGYRENERLGGIDPYSSSKACSELVSESYKKSFLNEKKIPLSTCRAGNVIGGGDYAADRIIPDCVRAATDKRNMEIRNPNSTRPYQHVLEPLLAYLIILLRQAQKPELSGNYNIGPDDKSCINTHQVVHLFGQSWGKDFVWTEGINKGPHEATFLKLDCSKVKQAFDISPKWNIEQAILETVKWYQAYLDHENMKDYTEQQIFDFLNES